MEPKDYQELLRQENIAQGQRIAASPKTPEFANNPEITGLRSSYGDKMKEMFSYDKTVADRYANPESSMFLEDPYAREKARYQRHEGSINDMASIQRRIGNVKDAVMDEFNKAKELFDLSIEQGKQKLDSLLGEYNMSTDLRDFDYKKQRDALSDSKVSGKKAEEEKSEKILNELIRYFSTEAGTPEEALESYNAIIRKNPENADEAQAAIESVFGKTTADMLNPKEDDLTTSDKKSLERIEVASALQGLGDTSSLDPNTVFQDLRLQVKHLSDSELKTQMSAYGLIIY